ncbi:hypothetical protein, partial [Streptomyces albidoflavus]|uniref:hypothetical protein n=1 Tax=Streptomyces albidoflavus TaxID=1886 RepID=UPI00211BDD07
MAGFRSLARQVRDPRCDLALRRYSLRKCLERFAPYGHRATWDHLCSRHGFGPEDRSPDPARLEAALTEVEEARDLWLAHEARFAARRRREKHDGLRRPAGVDTWQRRTGSGYALAWCDNPRLHPSLPLPHPPLSRSGPPHAPSPPPRRSPHSLLSVSSLSPPLSLPSPPTRPTRPPAPPRPRPPP